MDEAGAAQTAGADRCLATDGSVPADTRAAVPPLGLASGEALGATTTPDLDACAPHRCTCGILGLRGGGGGLLQRTMKADWS